MSANHPVVQGTLVYSLVLWPPIELRWQSLAMKCQIWQVFCTKKKDWPKIAHVHFNMVLSEASRQLTFYWLEPLGLGWFGFEVFFFEQQLLSSLKFFSQKQHYKHLLYWKVTKSSNIVNWCELYLWSLTFKDKQYISQNLNWLWLTCVFTFLFTIRQDGGKLLFILRQCNALKFDIDL